MVPLVWTQLGTSPGDFVTSWLILGCALGPLEASALSGKMSSPDGKVRQGKGWGYRRYFSLSHSLHHMLSPSLKNSRLFRSTSKSRPNNIRGGNNVRPYVRTSVRPQKVSSISMKFGM